MSARTVVGDPLPAGVPRFRFDTVSERGVVGGLRCLRRHFSSADALPAGVPRHRFDEVSERGVVRARRRGRVTGAVAEAVRLVVRALAAAHVELGRDRGDELDGLEAGALRGSRRTTADRRSARNCTSGRCGLPRPSPGTVRPAGSAACPFQPSPRAGGATRLGSSRPVIAMLISATGLPRSYPSPTARWAAASPAGSTSSAASRLGNASTAFGMLIAATK